MPQLLVTVSEQAMLSRLKMAIKTLRGVEQVTTPRKSARTVAAEKKEKVKAKINEALEELKLRQKGELQFQSAESLIEEL